MWPALLIAALMSSQGGGGRGGLVASANTSLDVTLAAPIQFLDGRLAGASVKVIPSDAPWFVYSQTSLCRSMISRTAPADATDGWRVTVNERTRGATQITLSVNWQRVWERGRAVSNGSGGTSELTLQSGDRVGLDQLVRPTQPGVCAATSKTLELRVTRTVTPILVARPPASAGPVAPTAPVIEPDAPIDTPVLAELWMVHRSPGGSETVDYQAVQLITGGVGFMFRSLPADTAEGAMVIDLNGQLRAVQRADGTRGLAISLTRSFTQVSTGQVRFSGSGGNKTLDWLAPGDVISVDLPDPGTPGARGGGGGGGGGFGSSAGAGGAVARSGGAGGGTDGSATSGGVGRAGGGARSGGATFTPNSAAMTPTAGAEAFARLAAALSGHQVSLRVRLITP